jgi:hypothetical protein
VSYSVWCHRHQTFEFEGTLMMIDHIAARGLFHDVLSRFSLRFQIIHIDPELSLWRARRRAVDGSTTFDWSQFQVFRLHISCQNDIYNNWPWYPPPTSSNHPGSGRIFNLQETLSPQMGFFSSLCPPADQSHHSPKSTNINDSKPSPTRIPVPRQCPKNAEK